MLGSHASNPGLDRRKVRKVQKTGSINEWFAASAKRKMGGDGFGERAAEMPEIAANTFAAQNVDSRSWMMEMDRIGRS